MVSPRRSHLEQFYKPQCTHVCSSLRLSLQGVTVISAIVCHNCVQYHSLADTGLSVVANISSRCAAACIPLSAAFSNVEPRQKSPHATKFSSLLLNTGVPIGFVTNPAPHRCMVEKHGCGRFSAPMAGSRLITSAIMVGRRLCRYLCVCGLYLP